MQVFENNCKMVCESKIMYGIEVWGWHGKNWVRFIDFARNWWVYRIVQPMDLL
jgi:hypothetical protein